MKNKPSPEGTSRQKTFYEDPTLSDDEKKAEEAAEEKRAIEEALRPATIDLNTPNENGAITKTNSLARLQTEAEGAIPEDPEEK